MMDMYRDKIPLEGLLRMVSPKSLWFTVQKYSDEYIAGLMEKAKNGTIHYDHCWHDNACILHVWRKTVDVTIRVSRLYTAIHVLQFLFFNKSKDKYTSKGLLKLLRSILKSIAFIGTFSMIAKFGLCYGPQFFKRFTPIWCMILSGASGAGILFENPSRWGEISMSVATQLPDAIQKYLQKQGLWRTIPMGHNLLFAFSLGVISYVYYSEEKCLKKLHQAVADQIFGKFNGKRSPKKTDKSQNNTNLEDPKSPILPQISIKSPPLTPLTPSKGILRSRSSKNLRGF